MEVRLFGIPERISEAVVNRNIMMIFLVFVIKLNFAVRIEMRFFYKKKTSKTISVG